MHIKEVLAAIERYDGPTYQILRKMRREGFTFKNLDVLILSAKIGLLGCQQPIEDYNQRMTAKRADQLRPTIHAQLDFVIRSKKGGYNQVFIHLGKIYRSTLEGFHWGWISTLEAFGRIGQKNQQMKAWLERLGRYQKGGNENNGEREREG